MQTCLFGPCAPPDRTVWRDFLDYLGTQNEKYRRQFREKFYARYAGPVYWCIRRMGLRDQMAEDLTQAFFEERILGGRSCFLDRVKAPENWQDHPKPRFRYFLQCIDQYREICQYMIFTIIETFFYCPKPFHQIAVGFQASLPLKNVVGDDAAD